ncbi:DNA topology modulation protein [Bradyrhizobium prioriisuperbiae]|uniref:DNA topology modulation protein n=1 Tax=Bradyrhizobium prioriisuperbiae TaxID=2854389 RepID=UPI0028EC163D|nr:DNA topology modulation protein [Bradyrhizobium prioritasuperba]
MRRVMVMGSSGSGKSTFARRLSAATGLPMVSIDALYWQPGWRPSDPFSFERRMTEAANEPTWIMDGNYISHCGELRRGLADTIVWFDLPRWVCMSGIFRRVITSYGQVRPEMAAGCPEQFDAEFIRYVWTYRRQQRPRLLAFFKGLRPDQTFITFTHRRQADDYLAHRATGLVTAGA